MELRDKNGLTEKEFLDSYVASDFPRPSVTVDIVIFAQNGEEIEVLMIKRAGHPSLGKWALPGGFVNPGENADTAAHRELYEETHVKGLHLEQLGMFSDPNRDPRTWVITQAYITLANKSNLEAQADDDADDADWFKILTKEKDNGNIDLLLKSEKAALSAVLNIKTTQTQFGRSNDISILKSEGIAFDHAKIIMSGLLKLQKR